MKKFILPSLFNKFAASCVAIMLCGVLFCPPAIAGTITVDAGTNVSESGQNDITRIQQYCRGSGYPGILVGVGDTTATSLAVLGFNEIVGTNVDNTDTGNNINSSGAFEAGSPLDAVLQEAKTYGYSPHVVVAQQRPANFPPDPWTWSASTWDEYKNYAYEFVRYVARDYGGSGFSNAVIEVTGETDIAPASSIWTQQNPGGIGSPERYAHLKTVYEIWQAAVAQVASENPDRVIRVAGPVVGASYAPFSWRDAFIDDVADNGWRLDLYTFHTYGDIEAVGNSQPHPDFGYLRDNLKAIQDKLSSRGLSTPIAITEWGASGVDDGADLGRINYTHEGAAWIVAFTRDAIGKGLLSADHLNMRDNDDPTVTVGNLTRPTFIHYQSSVEYPKPVFNACKMLAQLPGTRKVVDLPVDQPNLVSIAAGNTNAASVIVANYRYLFDYPNKNFTDGTVPEDVRVQFDGLPFSGQAIAQQYLIDVSTSNLAAYLDAGQQPDLEGTNLQKVSEVNVVVLDGSVTLPSVVLGKSAVSLWVVQSLDPIANGDYKIVAKHSLKSLDVAGSSQSNGAKVQQWTYGGGSNQQWSITSVGNGYYKLISKHTADTVDPKGLTTSQGSAENGVGVVQASYIGAENQQWQIIPVGGGFYKLIPRNSTSASVQYGLDVDVTGGGVNSVNGAHTLLWSNASNNNQLFRFESP
jgi:xylan 1,4-beta-xylosidase